MMKKISSFIQSQSPTASSANQTSPTSDLDFTLIRAKLSLKKSDENSSNINKFGNIPFFLPFLSVSSFAMFVKSFKSLGR